MRNPNNGRDAHCPHRQDACATSPDALSGELFRLRNDAAVSAFGESRQGQLQATWVEFRIGRGAMPFMEEENSSRLRRSQNPLGHQRGVAPHGIESPRAPAD